MNKLKLFESMFVAFASILVFCTCLIGLGLVLKCLWLLVQFGWKTI